MDLLRLFTLIHHIYHTHAQFRFREGVTRPPLVETLREALKGKTHDELTALHIEVQQLQAELRRMLKSA